MGSWAKSLFGRESFDDVAIVLAGTIKPEVEKEIVSFFDEVVSCNDAVYHAYLVRKGKKFIPVVFNVYGAPAMMDVLTELHDGGVRNVVFIGYAYGGLKDDLPIGSFVVPSKAYHFHGLYHHSEPSREFDVPDSKLLKVFEELLKKKKIKFRNGINISVPAVTFQLPHHNKKYQKIDPLTVEMELAACFSRAKDIGIRSVGCLIISDNRKVSIGDSTKKRLRYESKVRLTKLIIDSLKLFSLPHLKVKKKFFVNEYLASVIDLPNSKNNVYKGLHKK